MNTESNISSQIKSRRRVADHGEVFTAPREVNAMLDLVKDETQRIESRFLEPACGTGNFMTEILRRKLAVVTKNYRKNQYDWENYALLALGSVYGIDILLDNVEKARELLLEIFTGEYNSLFKKSCKTEIIDSASFILKKNVIFADALSMKTCDTQEDIVFSEWSLVSGRFKRRDFKFKELTERGAFSKEDTLFSDLGDEAVIFEPLREFPLCTAVQLASAENL